MTSRTLFATTLLLVTSLPLQANSNAANLVGKPDQWFSGDQGKHVLSCILSWQTPNGDWPNRNTTKILFKGDRKQLSGSFANGATTSELRTLARAARLTDDVRYKQAVVKGVDLILEAQYQNGGWAKQHTSTDNSNRSNTFECNCMIGLMNFLREVVTDDDFAFLDASQRTRAETAVQKAVNCILDCQVVVNGERTIWCAQNDTDLLKPVQQQSDQDPPLATIESGEVLLFLMRLDDPSLEVIDAVRSGVHWFRSTKIVGHRYSRKAQKLVPDDSASPLWARFYELETNRPIFTRLDGGPEYEIKKIDKIRRIELQWYDACGEKVLNAYSTWDHL